MQHENLRKLMHERLDKSLDLIFSRTKGELVMANMVIGIHDEPWKNEEYLYEGRVLSVHHSIIPNLDDTFSVDDASYTIETYGEQEDASKVYQLDFAGDILQPLYISLITFEKDGFLITKGVTGLHPWGRKGYFEHKYIHEQLVSSEHTFAGDE
ncbi:MAG: hypothetical protein M0P69_18430 [Bacteroidales bacterium]|jgi:hypothetical protein|nr:hypothetical protein [Bacteroidales bacterium]